jgi:hypothetical protein
MWGLGIRLGWEELELLDRSEELRGLSEEEKERRLMASDLEASLL